MVVGSNVQQLESASIILQLLHNDEASWVGRAWLKADPALHTFEVSVRQHVKDLVVSVARAGGELREGDPPVDEDLVQHHRIHAHGVRGGASLECWHVPLGPHRHVSVGTSLAIEPLVYKLLRGHAARAAEQRSHVAAMEHHVRVDEANRLGRDLRWRTGCVVNRPPAEGEPAHRHVNSVHEAELVRLTHDVAVALVEHEQDHDALLELDKVGGGSSCHGLRIERDLHAMQASYSP
mmetsp:Transcript_151883/g.368833  ORF Transcript_151883/g.368833 Transcript_151883/m.368833 type:complete len:236 (+) Transcript_151883:1879-2586(+)